MANSGERRSEGSNKELERIIFFSDAIFAIAMTLLVVSITVPQIPANLVAQELPNRLRELLPNLFSYVISFLVIFSYWTVHHSMFSTIRAYDRGLMWMNGLFLMFVAFLPFPTALLGEYGDQLLVVAIYPGAVAITRLMLSVIWWYASSNYRLIDSEGLHPALIRAHHIHGVVITLMFVLSIGIAFYSVSAAKWSWVLLTAGNFIFLGIFRRRHVED